MNDILIEIEDYCHTNTEKVLIENKNSYSDLYRDVDAITEAISKQVPIWSRDGELNEYSRLMMYMFAKIFQCDARFRLIAADITSSYLSVLIGDPVDILKDAMKRVDSNIDIMFANGKSKVQKS